MVSDAFIARTARFRSFRFHDQLKVGEHEQFFYANRYMGLQALVLASILLCFIFVDGTGGERFRREQVAVTSKHYPEYTFAHTHTHSWRYRSAADRPRVDASQFSSTSADRFFFSSAALGRPFMHNSLV